MTRNTKPIALSLFSGDGGMDLGVTQAGFKILAAVESDPHCCETLRTWTKRSRKKTEIIEADIRTINPKELRDSLGMKSGELDLLFGGPPCQAFSQIGKRESLKDERGLLLFEIVRFAKAFKPKAILLEQVKGLLNAPDTEGRAGGVLELFVDELDKLGYVPKWQVINAADYGVPQLRKRVFIVATPKPNGFAFPEPTHQKPGHHISFFPLPDYLVAGDVLKGLPRPKRRNGSTTDGSHYDVTPEGDQGRITGVPEGGHLAAQLHLPKSQRQRLTKKDTTKYRRLSRKEPSLTLRCGEIFFHPTQNRYLTPKECLLLHGYPDTFSLKGPIRSRSGRVRDLDQHRQVANSVPPPVAKAIAGEILRVLKWHHKSSRSSATL